MSHQVFEILDELKARGARVRSLKVYGPSGEIDIQFAEPWPTAERPAPISPEDDRKERLRRASKLTFGHIKPDEELEQMHKDGLL